MPRAALDSVLDRDGPVGPSCTHRKRSRTGASSWSEALLSPNVSSRLCEFVGSNKVRATMARVCVAWRDAARSTTGYRLATLPVPHCGGHSGGPVRALAIAAASTGYGPEKVLLISGSSKNYVHIWQAASSQASGLKFLRSAKLSGMVVRPRDLVLLPGQKAVGLRQKIGRQSESDGDSANYEPLMAVSTLSRSPTIHSLSGNLPQTERNASESVRNLVAHTAEISSLASLPDGRLISGSLDRRVFLWPAQVADVHVNSCTAPCPSRSDRAILIGICGGTVSALIALSNELVACGCWDRSIYIWKVPSVLRASERQVPGGVLEQFDPCEPLHRLQQHDGPISALAASTHRPGNAGWLASGSFDRTIKIWDSLTFLLLHTLVDHQDVITALAASPSETATGMLISSSQDGNVLVWDLRGSVRRKVGDNLDAILTRPPRMELLAKYLKAVRALAWLPSDNHGGKVICGSDEECSDLAVWRVMTSCIETID